MKKLFIILSIIAVSCNSNSGIDAVTKAEIDGLCVKVDSLEAALRNPLKVKIGSANYTSLELTAAKMQIGEKYLYGVSKPQYEFYTNAPAGVRYSIRSNVLYEIGDIVYTSTRRGITKQESASLKNALKKIEAYSKIKNL